ncbi:hypothetical protein DXB41_02670 [Segatella copri]|nr:hypothetical protein DXB41_02670 [Segatella copri]
MNVLIILIFSTLYAANIREISEIAKEFLVFNIVPQIAQMNTDLRDLFGQILTDFYDHFFLFVCLGGCEGGV